MTSDARGPGGVPGAPPRPRPGVPRALRGARLLLLAAALACRGPRPEPVAQFGEPGTFEIEVDAEPGAGPAPLTIQFTGEATNAQGTVRWRWDFADGTTSDEQNPRHTYTRAAKYDVQVTATDDAGAADHWSIQVRAWTPEEWEAGRKRHRPDRPAK